MEPSARVRECEQRGRGRDFGPRYAWVHPPCCNDGSVSCKVAFQIPGGGRAAATGPKVVGPEDRRVLRLIEYLVPGLLMRVTT